MKAIRSIYAILKGIVNPRQKKFATQAQIARALNISRQGVNRWIMGLSTSNRIASFINKATGCSFPAKLSGSHIDQVKHFISSLQRADKI